MKTCNVCEDRKEKQHGLWLNNATCQSIDNEKSCGTGNLMQTRQCIDGTFDKCSLADTEKIVECSLHNCPKMLGQWSNKTSCIISGQDKSCGPGMKKQARTCLNGTVAICNSMDIERTIPCNVDCDVIIQVHRRGKGNVFQKNWNEYKSGFGS